MLRAFWIGSVADASDRLRQHGGRTHGEVVTVRPDTRGSSCAAKVAYTVDGNRFVEAVDLGSYVDDYTTGQSVMVFYDL